MVATIAAVEIAVLVPLLLLAPLADDALNVLGWATAVLLTAHASTCLLLRRHSRWHRQLPGLAVPLWSGALAFVWASGLVDPASCGTGAAVILVFATSEFGPRAGLATGARLAAVGGASSYAVGGWSAAAHLPLLAAGLGMVFALTVQLVADHDRVSAQLRALATTDALTGLVTRRAMDDALAAALADDDGRTGAGLVLVDLDEFKAVNDAHGHPGGDAALKHLAQVLTESVRSGDDVVCRLGGDEMAVLLPGCPPQVLARRAQELVQAVRAAPLVLPDGSVLRLTVSTGAAHAPTHAHDARSLYAAADRALYASKAAGRDRASIARPDASDTPAPPRAPAAS